MSSDVQPFFGACSEVAYMNDGDNYLVTREGIQSADILEVPELYRWKECTMSKIRESTTI